MRYKRFSDEQWSCRVGDLYTTERHPRTYVPVYVGRVTRRDVFRNLSYAVALCVYRRWRAKYRRKAVRSGPGGREGGVMVTDELSLCRRMTGSDSGMETLAKEWRRRWTITKARWRWRCSPSLRRRMAANGFATSHTHVEIKACNSEAPENRI